MFYFKIGGEGRVITGRVSAPKGSGRRSAESMSHPRNPLLGTPVLMHVFMLMKFLRGLG